MKTRSCVICWAVVPSEVLEYHHHWHEAISRVAIESTQRIDALTKRIREIEAGYGDR